MPHNNLLKTKSMALLIIAFSGYTHAQASEIKTIETCKATECIKDQRPQQDKKGPFVVDATRAISSDRGNNSSSRQVERESIHHSQSRYRGWPLLKSPFVVDRRIIRLGNHINEHNSVTSTLSASPGITTKVS